MQQLLLRTTTVAVILSMTASCATLNEQGAKHGTMIGCIAGGALGGTLGALANGSKGAIIGAVAGVAAGCLAGNAWQNRLQALQKLAQEEHLDLQTETLQVESVPAAGQPAQKTEAGIVAQVGDSEMFPVGSDQLTPDGRRQLQKLAALFAPVQGQQAKAASPILVIGHTDATGSAELNQRLSERRAHAVGQLLAEAGVDPKNVYFQGVGASRPIADNSREEGRARNRRVELVEVASLEILQARIAQERGNPKYLANGTSTALPRKTAAAASPAAPASPVLAPVATTGSPAPGRAAAAPAAKPAKPSGTRQTAQARAAETAARRLEERKAVAANYIDFGGRPDAAATWDLASYIKPKSGGAFTVIGSAYASQPLRSCEADRPRVAGEVKNLASGAGIGAHATREYLPGMNGRAWAGLVNGNLVTLSPVAVLSENAAVVQNPRVLIVKDYAANNRVPTTLAAVANTYEGDDAILYRVFIEDASAPVSCLDVVLRKVGDRAFDGKLYYDRSGDSYVADFAPVRS